MCRWPLGVVGLRCRNKILSGASGLEPKHKGGKDDPSAIVDRPLVVAGSHRLPLRDAPPGRAGAQSPEDAVDHQPVVAPLPPGWPFRGSSGASRAQARSVSSPRPTILLPALSLLRRSISRFYWLLQGRQTGSSRSESFSSLRRKPEPRNVNPPMRMAVCELAQLDSRPVSGRGRPCAGMTEPRHAGCQILHKFAGGTAPANLIQVRAAEMN